MSDKLKSVSVQKLEEKFSESVTSLLGGSFKCSISKMDFSSMSGATIKMFLLDDFWASIPDEDSATGVARNE